MIRPPFGLFTAIALLSTLALPCPAAEKAKEKKPKNRENDANFDPKLANPSINDQLHPLFQLEDLYPSESEDLKISAMAFGGDDLFVTSFVPDREDKAPDRDGKIYRVSGLLSGNKEEITSTRLMSGLYEPTAIAVVNGKIYVGEKDNISRLEDANGDGLYTDDEDDPIAYAKAKHAAVCAACHTLDDTRLTGPSFKGLFGKEQEVVRDGKTVTLAVDEEYLLRAIEEPMAEYPVGFLPAMPALGLQDEEKKALVKWIKSLK